MHGLRDTWRFRDQQFKRTTKWALNAMFELSDKYPDELGVYGEEQDCPLGKILFFENTHKESPDLRVYLKSVWAVDYQYKMTIRVYRSSPSIPTHFEVKDCPPNADEKLVTFKAPWETSIDHVFTYTKKISPDDPHEFYEDFTCVFKEGEEDLIRTILSRVMQPAIDHTAKELLAASCSDPMLNTCPLYSVPGDEMCPICHETCSDVLHLPWASAKGCKSHRFHSKCIQRWISEKQATCPMCRAKLG